MKNVRFLPWIGSQYSKGIEGKKVMVLGESHYCENQEDAISEITQQVIQAVKEREERYNAYSFFEKAMIGKKDVSEQEASNLWDSLLFYNYVQVAMPTPNTRPNAEEFRNAEIPFLEVLEEYKPNVIIVWGSPLYNKLPQQGVQGDDILIDDMQLETWIYTLSNGEKAKVVWINHPASRGFLWEKWHKVINVAIR